jgi:hypothetical protein
MATSVSTVQRGAAWCSAAWWPPRHCGLRPAQRSAAQRSAAQPSPAAAACMGSAASAGSGPPRCATPLRAALAASGRACLLHTALACDDLPAALPRSSLPSSAAAASWRASARPAAPTARKKEKCRAPVVGGAGLAAAAAEAETEAEASAAAAVAPARCRAACRLPVHAGTTGLALASRCPGRQPGRGGPATSRPRTHAVTCGARARKHARKHDTHLVGLLLGPSERQQGAQPLQERRLLMEGGQRQLQAPPPDGRLHRSSINPSFYIWNGDANTTRRLVASPCCQPVAELER